MGLQSRFRTPAELSNFNPFPRIRALKPVPPQTTARPAEPPVPWLHDHPRDWRRGTLDAAALAAAAQALCGRAGFDLEVRRFAACWLQGYGSSPVLRTVMRNNARYVLLLACLWLDHARDPAMPEVSVTPGRVLGFYERIDHQLVVGGRSRIKTILGHVCAAGLLQPSEGRGDRRRRPLEPTPALREAMAGYVAGFLRGIEPALPLPASPRAMVAAPGFIGELFTYRLAALLHDRYSINQGLSPMTWVTNREKGYPLLQSLMRTLALQPDGSALTRGVPQQMADLAGISRGTARNFLQACVEQGWMQPHPQHVWQLQPAFMDAVMQWMGREFVWMHGLACAAWDAVRAP